VRNIVRAKKGVRRKKNLMKVFTKNRTSWEFIIIYCCLLPEDIPESEFMMYGNIFKLNLNAEYIYLS
jgi:hypothetical protein